MRLPRLRPTKLFMNDGPEIMFLWLFLKRFPDKILTQMTTPSTQFWQQMKAQNSYFPTVSILVIKFIIEYVLI